MSVRDSSDAGFRKAVHRWRAGRDSRDVSSGECDHWRVHAAILQRGRRLRGRARVCVGVGAFHLFRELEPGGARASWKRSPIRSWRWATSCSSAGMPRPACRSRGSRASAAERWGSCACSRMSCARAAGSACGSTRPCPIASPCRVPDLRQRKVPLARSWCSAPAISRWRSPWRVATPRRRSRPAARSSSKVTRRIRAPAIWWRRR